MQYKYIYRTGCTQDMKFCLVNGIPQSQIDIQNRGLAYGDGLFTTAKILNGKIQYLASHLHRLCLGCEKLGLVVPNKIDLSEQLTTVAQKYSLAVLKVIITAGNGGRGYARSVTSHNDVIIMVHDFPKHYDELAINGVTLGESNQQIGINPMLSGLKHLNRLEQVLLRQELSQSKYDDLIVSNVNGDVIEATSANLFFWHNERLCTPDITNSGVNGIMRLRILQSYPDTVIKKVTLADLNNSQAMFICNCVMGVMPVNRYNGNILSIKLPLSVRDLINEKVLDAS
jgi:4-amino-4-deoxychorismate lyase